MMWKEKYKIGVPLIDDQHEELFDRVTSFIQSFREKGPWAEKQGKIVETMEFMQEYVIVHFNDEEQYQKQIQYPLMESHKNEHERFKKNVEEYVLKIKNTNFAEETVQEFGGKLMTWLIIHVAGNDQKIGEYVESLIKSQHIDPFFYATKEVFQIMLDFSTEKGKVTVVNTIHNDLATNYAYIELGVVGELEGKVIFSIPVEMTLNMVNIMCGMEVSEVDLFVTSALGEIANIIVGNAVTKLSESQLICDIIPPKVTLNPDHLTEIDQSFLKIPILTPIGNGNLHLMLKKA